jgi:hypothetical protein
LPVATFDHVQQLSRAGLVVWCALTMAGCAAISGLDQITLSECAPYCDDERGYDMVDGPNEDGPEERGMVVEASMGRGETGDHEAGGGAGHEAGPDASEEASPDAPQDAPDDAPAPPSETGCGPLNAVENCSACGDECAPTSTSVTMASCSGQSDGLGSTCSYVCATGYLDCNGPSNPPDLDGCECYAPNTTCICDAGCPLPHSDDGFGTSYVACSSDPLMIAMAACAAFTGDASQCDELSCPSPAGSMVCSDGSWETCACWEYSGPVANHVYDSTEVGMCYCPLASDPTYD